MKRRFLHRGLAASTEEPNRWLSLGRFHADARRGPKLFSNANTIYGNFLMRQLAAGRAAAAADELYAARPLLLRREPEQSMEFTA